MSSRRNSIGIFNKSLCIYVISMYPMCLDVTNVFVMNIIYIYIYIQWTPQKSTVEHFVFVSEEYVTNTHLGWLRLVGSIQFYVSFAEYCLFYRALLQKRPVI